MPAKKKTTKKVRKTAARKRTDNTPQVTATWVARYKCRACGETFDAVKIEPVEVGPIAIGNIVESGRFPPGVAPGFTERTIHRCKIPGQMGLADLVSLNLQSPEPARTPLDNLKDATNGERNVRRRT